MTVHLVISLLQIPCIHHICIWFWPTLLVTWRGEQACGHVMKLIDFLEVRFQAKNRDLNEVVWFPRVQFSGQKSCDLNGVVWFPRGQVSGQSNCDPNMIQST